MPEAHARLGPSNHRWPHCPGSIREEAQYVDVAGAAAIDGTGSHLLLEMCLENNCLAEVYDGQIIGANHPDNPMGWMVGPDRIDRVQMCLDYVSRRVGELKRRYPDAEIVVQAESKSDPGGMFGRTDWWGTCDITIIVRKWTEPAGCLFIEVADYKDGRGYVSEKNNSQLISYAAGKARQYIASGPDLVRPFHANGVRDGIRMTIVQPKTNPVIRYQDQTTDWLINEMGKLSVAARNTDEPDAPLHPGKHCEWCKANPKRGGHCTAAAEKSLEVIQTMEITTTDGDLMQQLSQLTQDVTTIPADQLSKLISARDALNAVFDKLESEATRRIETGDTVPGYAMRPGRASRVWNISDDEMAELLKSKRFKRDDIYPPKVVSPAQLEKMTGISDKVREKILEEYCTTKAGKMKLTKVAHGDEAPAMKDVQSAEMMFAGVAQSSTDVVQSEPESTPEVSFF